MFSIIFFLLFGLVFPINAELIDRGGGMIYSTDLDITWLQDANYVRTSEYDEDGFMTWYEAMEWAENLSYGGFDDWRLPTYDPNSPQQSCDTTKLNEMAYLLYVELDNCSLQEPYNHGPFTNVLPDEYFNGTRWSGTEYDQSNAWYLIFSCG